MTDQQNEIAPETVTELRELMKKATPGPWHVYQGRSLDNVWHKGRTVAAYSIDGKAHGDIAVAYCDYFIPELAEANASLIVLLHNNADAILAALHRLPSYNAVAEGLCWSSELPPPAQFPSEELLAAEAEAARLREIVDDMRIEVARITDNAATEIVRLKNALERIALLDEADGHELTVDHAFQAVAIATRTLGKHPSEIHKEQSPLSQGEGEAVYNAFAKAAMRYTAPAQPPLSQGGVTLRELGESYCEEQPAPGAEAVAKAICCPQGCVRDDDCLAGQRREEQERTEAIMALLRSPAIPTSVQEVAAERERCARIVESWHPEMYAPEMDGKHPRDSAYSTAKKYIAAAIRSPAMPAPAQGVTVTEWQPIETAPKNGSPNLLLWQPNRSEPQIGGWIENSIIYGRSLWMAMGGHETHPTHWQPLPDPPIEAALHPSAITTKCDKGPP